MSYLNHIITDYKWRVPIRNQPVWLPEEMRSVALIWFVTFGGKIIRFIWISQYCMGQIKCFLVWLKSPVFQTVTIVQSILKFVLFPLKAQHTAAYIGIRGKKWMLFLLNKPMFQRFLSAQISSRSRITSCDKRTHTCHHDIAQQRRQTCRRLFFVLSLFVAAPICGSSAATTQSTVGLCLQQ